MPALGSLPPDHRLLTVSRLDVEELRPFDDESLPVAIHVPAYTAPRSIRAAAAFASPRGRRRSRLRIAFGVSALTIALVLALAAWPGAAGTPAAAPSPDGADPAAASR